MPDAPAPAVTLRPVGRSDVPTLYEHAIDPEANRMVAIMTSGATDRAAFDARWERILADPEIVARAILADGELAGHLVCFPSEGEREVGYWLGRAFWGRGIASRALALFLAELPMRPLHAHVAADNIGSRRVLENNGFRPIGAVETFSEVRAETVRELIFVLD